MPAAREYDLVRTTTDIAIGDGRIIRAGTRGAVLHAEPDGTCLAESTFASQTVDSDFVQGVLTRDQYEVTQD